MTDVPAINEKLIRQYVDQHTSGDPQGFRNLLTIFDFQRRQMQRAEDLCRTAWAEVERMAKLGRTAPTTDAGLRTTSASGRTEPGLRTAPKPTPKAPPAPAAEINLDDL